MRRGGDCGGGIFARSPSKFDLHFAPPSGKLVATFIEAREFFPRACIGTTAMGNGNKSRIDKERRRHTQCFIMLLGERVRRFFLPLAGTAVCQSAAQYGTSN